MFLYFKFQISDQGFEISFCSRKDAKSQRESRPQRFVPVHGITRTGSCATDGATAPSRLRITLLPVDSGTSTMSLACSITSSARLRAIALRFTYISDF